MPDVVEDRPNPANFLFARPQYFIALGFGAGLLPYAPGTIGAGIGAAIYWGIALLPVIWQVAVIAVLFVAGCYFCEVTGSVLGTPDHRAIVWDEIWGMMATLAVVPATPAYWVTAFVLFRLFDILKPWPISTLERRVQGGFGVMFDDTLAAAFSALLLIAINRIVS